MSPIYETKFCQVKITKKLEETKIFHIEVSVLIHCLPS